MKETISTKKKVINDDKVAIIMAIVSGVIVIALSIFFICVTGFRTAQKFYVKEVELGNPVPSHVYNYVTGFPFLHDGIEVDYSHVDNMNTGSYEVEITGKLNFTCTIKIVDTTVPYIILLSDDGNHNGANNGTSGANANASAGNINPNSGVYYSSAEERIVLELGELYDVTDIVCEIGDISESYEAQLKYKDETIAEYRHYPDDRFSEMFSIDESGNYVFELIVTDGAGNTVNSEINAMVIDSQGPKIKVPDYLSYFATDCDYTVDDIVAEIIDASGVESYCFVVDGTETDMVGFDAPGSYDIAIKAADILGNESFTEFSVSFDDAPVFVGVRDEIQILVGKEFDYTQFFRAVDNTDGDISGRMEFVSDLNINAVGSYDYECTVMDSHGLMSSYSGKIVVGSSDGTQYCLTPDEIDILNEYNYFSYDILAEDDYEAMIEMIEPTLVNLLKRYTAGGYMYGSGYIYKVDSDYIYIGTVDHVISEMVSRIELMFCDDEETVVSVLVTGYERVAENSECAMFKIPITDIPAKVLLDVKQVYYEEDIYEDMHVGQAIVAYSGHWANTTPTIKLVYVKRMDEQFMEGSQHCIVTSHGTKGGMSGCPLFDFRGRMVAQCEGYWGRYNYDINAYEYEGYQQRIEGLTELYERVKRLEYKTAG